MDRAQLDNIVRKLTDTGKIIEAGFVGFRFISIPEDAPQIQLDEMRNAFFAGAQHLFGSIMQMLEPGAEPTENDLRRMTLISEELDEFLKRYKRANGLGGANA